MRKIVNQLCRVHQIFLIFSPIRAIQKVILINIILASDATITGAFTDK